MKQYKVNEIFWSIQAEGYHSGTPAVFVRFSGCNLKCPWCDTQHENYTLMTKEEIEKEVNKLTDYDYNNIVVFTGGEPTLQLEEYEPICIDYFTTIETNGIIKPPSWINWITCSPKTDEFICADEYKFVLDNTKIIEKRISLIEEFNVSEKIYIQPLEKNGNMNIREVLNFLEENPRYKLSLQIHKLIGIK